MKKKEVMPCEACGEDSQVFLKVSGERKPYHLCCNCLSDLVNTRLSVYQFEMLIEKKHNTSEFYLHEDFYDESGIAEQPK